MADLSAAQKVEVARGFILQAPPGEVDEVVKGDATIPPAVAQTVHQNVNVLVGADAGLQDKLPDILREYNENNHSVLKSADGASVVISKAAQVDANKYKDHAAEKVFVVDHVTGQITGAEPLEVDPATEELRAPTQEALEKHVKGSLAAGSCSVVAAGPGKERAVEVQLGGDDGGGSGEITGTVVAEVHYYEEGNVQLNASKEVRAALTWGDSAAFAAAVAKTVSGAEAELQGFLEDSYRSMSDTSFKALRRKMPLTQTKFQWNKLTAYSLAQELTNK